MDTAPAAKRGGPGRVPAGERPEIGVPSIVTRAELDPLPVPSLSLPGGEALGDEAGRGDEEALAPETALVAEPAPGESAALVETPVSAVPIDPGAPARAAPTAPPVAAPTTEPVPAPTAAAAAPPPTAASGHPAGSAPPGPPVRLVALPSPAEDSPPGHGPRAPLGVRPVTSSGATAVTRGGLSVEDGEETFSPAVQAKLKSYVYLLVDPRTGRPFHAGLGRGDRCFDHVRAARPIDGRRATDVGPVNGTGQVAGERLLDQATGALREYPALERIRQIESSGRPVRIEILRYGLDPEEALLAEAVAHDLLGLPGDPGGGHQRRPVAEVRLLLTKRAKFKRSHQVVLLRAGPPGADTSYGRVRHGWRIGRRWTDVDAPRSPHWAVVVAGELVDSVYRLQRWEVFRPAGSGSDPGEAGGASDRHSFVGARDPELERRYVGKSVAPFMGRGSQSSLAYVWCGPHWVNDAR